MEVETKAIEVFFDSLDVAREEQTSSLPNEEPEKEDVMWNPKTKRPGELKKQNFDELKILRADNIAIQTALTSFLVGYLENDPLKRRKQDVDPVLKNHKGELLGLEYDKFQLETAKVLTKYHVFN